MKRIRETCAVIHLKNLEHNVRILKSQLANEGIFFCPMVKANAYGHGDVIIAKSLEQMGVSQMGVGLIEEGAFLRSHGVKTPILFFGMSDYRSIKEITHNKLIPLVSEFSQLKDLERELPEGHPVHLKFDTGMHRLGFSPEKTLELVDHFQMSSKLKLEGVLTHLHTGEDFSSEDSASFRQLAHFHEIRQKFQPITQKRRIYFHALNSAGYLNSIRNRDFYTKHLSLKNLGVRPGLALYGIKPIECSEIQLQPVMSLRSQVVKIQKVKNGDGVSYGHTWKASRDSLIGIVPIGYADGYHRNLSNKASVLWEDQRIPQIGNVCMDYLMVDLTDLQIKNNLDDILKGEITLFGESKNGVALSAEELAQKSGTIVWEILTSVGVRVPREVGL